MFSKLRAIFSTWQPLKSMHRRSVLSTFYFFHFLEIYEKWRKKPSKTGDQKKHRKMGPRGSQNWPKIAHNSPKIRQKSQKNPKKHENWRVDFWPFFRVAKKSKNEGITISGKSVLLAPGLQWGTIGGTINQYNSLSNTPMGQWPGELWKYWFSMNHAFLV